MTYENILYEVNDRLATVTVNRPKVLNALNDKTISELLAVFHEIAHDDGVGAVILTGAGEKSFIAGADINEISQKTPDTAKKMALKGADVPEPDREPGQAGHRGDKRVRAGRRLRDSDGVYDALRGGHGQTRPAGDQPGHHPRLRRHAAPAAAGGQGRGA